MHVTIKFEVANDALQFKVIDADPQVGIKASLHDALCDGIHNKAEGAIDWLESNISDIISVNTLDDVNIDRQVWFIVYKWTLDGDEEFDIYQNCCLSAEAAKWKCQIDSDHARSELKKEPVALNWIWSKDLNEWHGEWKPEDEEENCNHVWIVKGCDIV